MQIMHLSDSSEMHDKRVWGFGKCWAQVQLKTVQIHFFFLNKSIS